MNTENFAPFATTWPDIFDRQKKLKFLYEPEAKELYKNFDIDCFEDQELFKKYCWRITEELCEAIEALKNREMEHFQEELIDALNFTIELSALYGWTSQDFVVAFTPCAQPLMRVSQVSEVIYRLGLAANCLKNRQWRRSQYLVDLLVFEKRLRDFLAYIHGLLDSVFTSDEDIRKAWSLKYQVNMFRIQTNY